MDHDFDLFGSEPEIHEPPAPEQFVSASGDSLAVDDIADCATCATLTTSLSSAEDGSGRGPITKSRKCDDDIAFEELLRTHLIPQPSDVEPSAYVREYCATFRIAPEFAERLRSAFTTYHMAERSGERFKGSPSNYLDFLLKHGGLQMQLECRPVLVGPFGTIEFDSWELRYVKNYNAKTKARQLHAACTFCGRELPEIRETILLRAFREADEREKLRNAKREADEREKAPIPEILAAVRDRRCEWKVKRTFRISTPVVTLIYSFNLKACVTTFYDSKVRKERNRGGRFRERVEEDSPDVSTVLRASAKRHDDDAEEWDSDACYSALTLAAAPYRQVQLLDHLEHAAALVAPRHSTKEAV